MSGRNGQRKHGTTRGRPRRSRRGRAARRSRGAAKSRGAGEWGGWGRVSDEGLGQHNPDRSEGPWGSARDRAHGGAGGAALLDTVRGFGVGAKRTAGGGKPWRGTGMPGAGLTGARAGRPHSSRPCSRTGENPTYGMIGETVETSGALQARSAPLSYPTPRPHAQRTGVRLACDLWAPPRSWTLLASLKQSSAVSARAGKARRGFERAFAGRDGRDSEAEAARHTPDLRSVGAVFEETACPADADR